MSLAANLAKLAKTLLVQAGGFINGTAPSAGDNSAALITSAWFKGEQATETNQGTAKVATQAVTNAGTDDATIVTPKKLRAGFAISLTANGYIAFPTWLGGLIIQWGFISGVAANSLGTVTVPLAFPSGILTASVTVAGASTSANVYAPQLSGFTTTTFKIDNTNAGAQSYYWIAIGN